jgi:hypothetical protein
MRITVELLRITVDAGLVGYQKIAERGAHVKAVPLLHDKHFMNFWESAFR